MLEVKHFCVKKRTQRGTIGIGDWPECGLQKSGARRHVIELFPFQDTVENSCGSPLLISFKD